MSVVILDRDGVINQDSDDYIKSPDEWKPIQGSLEAIARLRRSNHRVVVVTNQSGIARGLFDIDTLNRIHRKMVACVREKGGDIDAIFFCPHAPNNRCDCRKPKPGLLLEVGERLGIPLSGVPFVGDSITDLEAAQSAGALPILIESSHGASSSVNRMVNDKKAVYQKTHVYEDLRAFVDHFLGGGFDLATGTLNPHHSAV